MDVNKIRIAKTKSGLNSNDADFSSVISEFDYRNVLVYMDDPKRTMDGKLRTENPVKYYIPEAHFSFNLLTPEQFRAIIQIMNTSGFYIKCYDYEIDRYVVRNMHLSSYEREKLLIMKKQLTNVVKPSFKMDCMESYLPGAPGNEYANLIADSENPEV